MGMRSLTYDPYPAKMADIIRQNTAPADKLVINRWRLGRELLFCSGRQGLSAWNAHIFDRPEDLAKLKSLGYNKLVMVSNRRFNLPYKWSIPGRPACPREIIPRKTDTAGGAMADDFANGGHFDQEIP